MLPLTGQRPFPETLTPLAVGEERSIKPVNDVPGGNRMLAMAADARRQHREPAAEDLYEVGVAGTVARMIKVPDGTLRILVRRRPAGPPRRLRADRALPVPSTKSNQYRT